MTFQTKYANIESEASFSKRTSRILMLAMRKYISKGGENVKPDHKRLIPHYIILVATLIDFVLSIAILVTKYNEHEVYINVMLGFSALISITMAIAVTLMIDDEHSKRR